MFDTNTTGVLRIVHFALMIRHLHLIVEAKDRDALSRGMQGFGVRLARRLNKELGRRGRVLRDRYHEHILRTPREVRNALCYVLRNSARGDAPASSASRRYRVAECRSVLDYTARPKTIAARPGARSWQWPTG